MTTAFLPSNGRAFASLHAVTSAKRGASISHASLRKQVIGFTYLSEMAPMLVLTDGTQTEMGLTVAPISQVLAEELQGEVLRCVGQQFAILRIRGSGSLDVGLRDRASNATRCGQREIEMGCGIFFRTWCSFAFEGLDLPRARESEAW